MGFIGGPDGPTEVFLSSNMGWLNAFGLITVILLMIPNIIYAIKHRGEKNKCENRAINLLEQIGRYGCLLLTVFNIGLAEFGFASAEMFLVYLFGSAALLLAYFALWIAYGVKRTPFVSISLAVVPTLLFLLCGITLRHWLLVAFALIFGVTHIYISVLNARE